MISGGLKLAPWPCLNLPGIYLNGSAQNMQSSDTYRQYNTARINNRKCIFYFHHLHSSSTVLVFFPTRSDRWNFFFCNATCEESSRDCDRERGEASGNGQAMHVIKHLKGKMIDSFGYRGFPIRGACGRLCPNSMSATEIEISPARHGLMSGHKSLPCLGFPSGHALPQPL